MSGIWKTVRIFISSTFRGMHAERDYLVRVVFPELRERMARRNLSLIDIDLRWGVTEEEAEHGKVLEIILDEIERSRPFFIAILGERYGHVPDTVPEDTRFTHPWLREYPEHSLTALEIVHGVLRNPELAHRSFFYFRSPEFISKIPEERRADFMPENPEAERKVKALKDKIRKSGRPVMEDYPCRWDDKEVHLIDLDVFGQRVLEDLWKGILEEYPEEAPEADPLAIERQMHETFAEERSRLHIGRVEYAKRLTEYVYGTDRRPVVITGESGCGKSAFLSNWYRKYSEENLDDFVLAYFVGASPYSTNHFRLLRNICGELKRRFNLKEEIPEDDKKLSETMAVMLYSASTSPSPQPSSIKGEGERSGKRIILLIDALDQLSPLEGSHGLGWLLDYIPEKVRLVVSTLEGDCLEILIRREAEEIQLPPLTTDEQGQIVKTVLEEWRRKLDDRQMTALLSHPGVNNPLYLRVALEELRLFGRFEGLTERIHSLSDDISGLFEQVFERLEHDHGYDLVTEAFSLLGCSRYGLSETELLDLLKREGEEQLPRALWLRINRGAKAYLVQRGELFGFFHRHLSDAVTKRYLSRERKHARLAEYFEHALIDRKLDEYPYQLQHAEEWEKLSKSLSDLDFFEYAWNRNREYEWMGYWRSLKGRFEPDKCYQSAIEARIRRDGETEGIASLSNIIGLHLLDIGLYSSAMSFSERSLLIREKTFGQDHPDVAQSLNNLAEIYIELGEFNKAELLHKQSITIREKMFGSGHPLVADSLNNLAVLFDIQGKYDEAKLLHKKALEIREKSFGQDHPAVGESLNNLAEHYKFIGRHVEAKFLYKQALVIVEKILGPNHLDIAATMNNLATLYYFQGKYADAEPLYKRSLDIREKILGSEHPLVAQTLNSIANVFLGQGKYNKAEPIHKKALMIREKKLDSEHPDIAESLNSLAVLYYSQGKFDEAEPLFTRAVKIAEEKLGPHHPETKKYSKNLKACQDAMGK